MNEQTLRFRIGVFILASLLLLAVLITLFGSFPRLFTPSQEYTILFKDVPGLDVGTPVRLSGVRIGEVKSIDLDDETGAVRVQIRIYRKYILRHNQDPTLVHGLLGGDTAIDFVPRREEVAQADRTPVEPGLELQGVPQATVSTLLNQASDVVPVAESALKEIRDSLKRLDKLTPILEETAKEYRDLAKATREVLPELKTTTKEVGDLAKAGREALPELKTTTKEVGDLAKAAQEALPDLRTTTKEVGDLAKDVRENVPELKKTITEAQVTLRTWDRLGEDARLLIRTNEDKVAKLLNDASDTLGRIGTLLSDENQRNFTATLKNVRRGQRTGGEHQQEHRRGAPGKPANGAAFQRDVGQDGRGPGRRAAGHEAAGGTRRRDGQEPGGSQWAAEPGAGRRPGPVQDHRSGRRHPAPHPHRSVVVQSHRSGRLEGEPDALPAGPGSERREGVRRPDRPSS